jgi:hypothetical protein
VNAPFVERECDLEWNEKVEGIREKEAAMLKDNVIGELGVAVCDGRNAKSTKRMKKMRQQYFATRIKNLRRIFLLLRMVYWNYVLNLTHTVVIVVFVFVLEHFALREKHTDTMRFY